LDIEQLAGFDQGPGPEKDVFVAARTDPSQSIEVPECFVEQSDVQVVDGEDIPMNDPIAFNPLMISTGSLGSSSGVIDTFVLREY
jgi:hypothetical protein